MLAPKTSEMSTLSQQSSTTIDISHETPTIIIEDVDDLPKITKSSNIILPWYADVEVVRQFIRTIHYLQNTPIMKNLIILLYKILNLEKMMKYI